MRMQLLLSEHRWSHRRQRTPGLHRLPRPERSACSIPAPRILSIPSWPEACYRILWCAFPRLQRWDPSEWGLPPFLIPVPSRPLPRGPCSPQRTTGVQRPDPVLRPAIARRVRFLPLARTARREPTESWSAVAGNACSAPWPFPGDRENGRRPPAAPSGGARLLRLRRPPGLPLPWPFPRPLPSRLSRWFPMLPDSPVRRCRSCLLRTSLPRCSQTWEPPQPPVGRRCRHNRPRILVGSPPQTREPCRSCWPPQRREAPYPHSRILVFVGFVPRHHSRKRLRRWPRPGSASGSGFDFDRALRIETGGS
mmetsp:Transcript_8574/g.25414  ORF Transcript_8574/g.25414 Transcript_8574/m.25414 type:complete len:308 (-) Transcript_8574:2618-3541(-)